MQICSCRRDYHFLIRILNFFFMLLLTFTLFFFLFFFPFPFFPFLSFPFFLFLFLFFLPTVFWSFTSLCGFPWTPHAIHRGYAVHNTNICTVYYKRKDSTYSEWSSELDAKISVCPYSLPGLGAGASTWLFESPYSWTNATVPPTELIYNKGQGFALQPWQRTITICNIIQG